MVNPPVIVAPEKTKRFDESLSSVALVVLALAGLIAVVLFLWFQVAPRGELASERYLPVPRGASFAYRVTHPDGSVTYRSRNIARGSASTFVSALAPDTFNALMQAAGIDLEQMGTTEALAKLDTFQMIETHDTESDAQGNLKTQTRSRSLVENDGIKQFGVNAVGIAPPIPLLPASNQSETLEGKLNERTPYRYTQQIEMRGSVATPLGELGDCIRVRAQLEYGANRSTSHSWYCAGIGEVLDETTDATGTTRSEIVAASVGGYVRGNLPALPNARVNAASQRVFENPIAGTPTREFDYTETTSGEGVTTLLVPLGDILLYGTQRGALVALDRTTVQQRWRFQTGDAIFSTPVVANGIAYFGSADKKVYAVRVSDGAFVWAFRTLDIVSASPALAGDSIFFASEDRTVYALDADTGQLRWKFSSGSPFIAAPVAQDDLVFVSNDDGTLFALRQATGRVAWEFSAQSAITAPVTLSDGRVYFGSFDSTVYALDEKDGTVVWAHDLSDTIQQPVLVANQRVYVTLPEEMFALDAQTGVVLWRYASDRALWGAPVLCGNQLWILRPGKMLAMNAASGALLDEVDTTQVSSYTGLSSDGEKLFAGFFDGTVLSFRGANP